MTKNKLKNASIIKKTEAYTIYELSFRRGGKKIYGNLYVPSRDQKQYSLVIMAHGFGSSYSYLTEYASKLVKNGIAAYIFDFCGGSSYSRSDGEMTKMSVLTEKKDLQTVFDSLKTESFVDQDHIFLMGESQGGLVAYQLRLQLLKKSKVQPYYIQLMSFLMMLEKHIRISLKFLIRMELWG